MFEINTAVHTQASDDLLKEIEKELIDEEDEEDTEVFEEDDK